MTFRWYGEGDSIPLDYIRQIPNMSGVVTAVYDVPVGEVWPLWKIERLQSLCKEKGLAMEVIESVPVSEDIKLGLPTREKHIEAYCQNIRNLGKVGVKCICYNFMPVFDWVRTDLHARNSDGSFSLAFDQSKISEIDEKNLHLPGWDESYSPNQLSALLKRYRLLTKEKLFENLVYFLKAVMPACNEAGVNMAIHPDDPPWDIFGLPRIISDEEWLDRLFGEVPDSHNGLTFCTGSLGASKSNDLISMAKKYANRSYFAHIRQLKIEEDGSFREAGHLSANGTFDIYQIVKTLVQNGFDGYVRPDHGRDIFGESAKPGYGLYDRALGACYLNGLFEAVEKENQK